ncbi:biotin carboxylase 1, chloroplastic-like isoform X2 [Apium graveolens]
MGDKSTARDTMKNDGVPTVRGSDGLLQSTEEAVRLAEEIGYPVMIKVHTSQHVIFLFILLRNPKLIQKLRVMFATT